MSKPSARESMRPFGELTPFLEAFDAALELVAGVAEARSVPLGAAAERVLSSSVVSPVDVPSADRAAMDGYAVIAADVGGASPDAPAVLRYAGSILAGSQPEGALAPGCCIEIATGAAMPEGSDAVIPVEETDRQGDRIAVVKPSRPGEHVSQRGEDLRVGEGVGEAGSVVTPAVASALASVGVQNVDVFRRPRVLVVPTGNEVVPVGEPLPPGYVYDSNSIAIAALVERNGAVVERTEIVGDDPSALEDAIRRPGFDLVVTLGGTSVGRHDLVLDIVGQLGEVIVHGIAVKPGKPLLLARVEGRPVVGLPGFPTSSLLLGYVVVEPMVRRMARLPSDGREKVRATLSEDVESPEGKQQFLTVTLAEGIAHPAYRASSTITSMSTAHGWITIVQESTGIAAGTPVEVTLF